MSKSSLEQPPIKKSESDDIDWSKPWNETCDWVARQGPFGQTLSNHFLRKIVINAPVILGFCSLCVVLHVLRATVWPRLGETLGVHDTLRFSFLQFTSLFTHVLAHQDYNHLRGNMMNLLLVGPTVEHAFGSKNLVLILVVVAITSALAHILVGSTYSHQLGASGVVFACILLNSLISASYGKIPLSFLITSMLYLGDELYRFFGTTDHVSHHAHLTGGLVGAVAGFSIHRQRQHAKTKRILEQWSGRRRKTK